MRELRLSLLPTPHIPTPHLPPPPLLREHFIEVGGYRVRYTVTGIGPLVVLVPTMFLYAESYRPTLRCLGRRFRVLTVGPPGTGPSDPLPRTWSMAEYADWLAAFLAAVAPGPVPVIGHSNSAGVVLLLAARHPGRVSRAILADPVGGDDAPSLWRMIPCHFAVAMAEMSFAAAVFPHVVYNALFHGRSLLNQVRIATTVLTAVAPRVAVPTLLAWGKEDWTTPLRCARRLYDLLPRPTFYLSKGGSHDWIIVRPAEFAAAVERFLVS